MRNLQLDDLQNIMRVKVNLRNMNNSARYYIEYLRSDRYDRERFLEMLDWEIIRYVNNMVRFAYFKADDHFKMPNEQEFDDFLAGPADRPDMQMILGIFTDTPASERENALKETVGKIKKDRNNRRIICE